MLPSRNSEAFPTRYSSAIGLSRYLALGDHYHLYSLCITKQSYSQIIVKENYYGTFTLYGDVLQHSFVS
jgi:hypothetical protein